MVCAKTSAGQEVYFQKVSDTGAGTARPDGSSPLKRPVRRQTRGRGGPRPICLNAPWVGGTGADFRGCSRKACCPCCFDRPQSVISQSKVIDLHTTSGELFQKLGYAGSAELANKAGDRTHFNEKGARAMAELVIKELPDVEPSVRALLK
jgi:hypothetical protein